MGYLITGRFRSSFPDGVDVEEKSEPKPDLPQEAEKEKKPPVHLAGLKEASQDCAVVVLADADFLSDILAYQNSFFGKIVVGDNSNLALNAIDTLSGSSDLISMRSRGNFGRPFAKVDEIEKQAEAATAEEESRINAEIEGFQKELGSILSSAKEGEEEIVGGSILQKKKDLELKLLEAQRKLRLVKMKKRERIEQLGNRLRSFNMLAAPAVILVIAIILSVRRGARKRYYISHASDA